MVWFGNYDKNRWKLAMDAGKAFFDALKTNGYYHLVQKEEVTPSDYRYAFRAAYFDRGTTETLISVRRDIFTINMSTPEGQAMRWGWLLPDQGILRHVPDGKWRGFRLEQSRDGKESVHQPRPASH